MTKRIWELDALRGLCIIGMILVHLLFNLSFLFGVIDLSNAPLFYFLSQWGGIPFFLISGICATFSSRTVIRGAVVFGCGLLCSGVTLAMYLLGFTDAGFLIYFGVLHCLGICMVLWPIFKKLPVSILLLLSVGIIAAGLYIAANVRTAHLWLLPFGLVSADLVTSDFFPLLPNLGYFLAGGVLGKTLYRSRQTLLPGVDPDLLPLRFLRLCGKHSLLIYLLHQPVLTALCFLITQF